MLYDIARSAPLLVRMHLLEDNDRFNLEKLDLVWSIIFRRILLKYIKELSRKQKYRFRGIMFL